MRYRVRRKAFCIAASILMGCSWIPNLIGVNAFADTSAQPVDAADSESNKLQRCVVRLKEPALIERFDKEALGTAETAADSEAIAAQQMDVQAQIREFYPDLTVGTSYSILLNGFACSLPENLFEKVRSLSAVEDVALLPEILVPEMANAPSLSGLPAFMEKTGCTGEGQVICVIDTELCADHPMFAALPDNVQTKLSKEDIAGIISSGKLHKTLDADQAYLSSKIPYAVDYVDEDPYGGLQDENNYHGTHVSGIAAGNSYVKSDGRTVSGMAPDAQLVFMAVGEGMYCVQDEAALQALEDAVLLHADVINLSWGNLLENYNDNLFANVLDVLDQAGVTVCTSAGNADNGTSSLHRSNYPESPDVSTIDHKTESGNSSFVVASADNNVVYQSGILRLDGEDFTYLPGVPNSGIPTFLTDVLPLGECEYVYFDHFDADDMDMSNAEPIFGKLMVVQHTSVETYAVAMGAMMRGAAGVLLVDDAAFQSGAMGVFCYDTSVPVGFISAETGKRLQNAEKKVIVNPGSKIGQTAENKMSFYSSWGTGHALDLRPDITGIGGSVESADYGGGTEVMSGTSMSSPYVAGAAAVVRQYLKQQGMEASGKELTKLIRKLMMNSAVPFEENGLLVSPRQQGAGLVSLERLMQTKAILAGPEDDAKVNLYDRIGDTFSFDVTLKNISKEDVTFQNAKLCLTTDDTAVNEDTGLTVINGQRALACTADLSALTMIKAGESKTVTVQVKLDSAQTAGISEVFKYGFFIDGFLLLSGAENSADISIPLCGYYGDWAQIPIFSTDTLMLSSEAGGCASFLALPLNEAIPLIDKILSRASQEEIAEALEYNSLSMLIHKYWTKEEDQLLERGHGDAWISPNGDGIHDLLSVYSFELKRQAKAHYSVLDAEGNVKYEDEKAVNPPQNNPSFYIFEKPLATLSFKECNYSELPEGDYTISTDMWINYPDAENHPQNFKYLLKIDKTAPEMECTVEQEGDKTYLNISASDSGELDCLFLTARCADASRKQNGITALNKLDLFSIYSGGDPNNYGFEGAEALPYVISKMIPKSLPKEDIYDYSEMFPAKLNESGKMELRYDITGLTNVTVTAIDRAWNYTVEEAVKGGDMTLKDGIWTDEGKGYMEVSGNTIRYADFYDGSVTEYSYTIHDDIMTITSPEKKIVRELYIEDYTNIKYREEGSDQLCIMRYMETDVEPKLEDIKFYSVKETYPRLKAFFERKTGLHITGYTSVETTPFEWYVTFETEEDVPVGERMIAVDMFRGYVHYQFLVYDLFSTPADSIEPGIYYGDNSAYYVVFNEDHQTGKILVMQSDILYDLNEFENLEFSYTIEKDDEITLRFDNEEERSGFVSVSDSGLLNLFVTQYGALALKRTDYDLSFVDKFHSRSQTEKTVSLYHEAVSGQSDTYLGGGVGDDGEIVHIFEGDVLYSINPFTLEGHDAQGRKIDYANPPELPQNAKSLDTLKTWALKDFADKTGRDDADAIAVITPDGNVDINMFLPDSAYDYEKEMEDPFPATRYSIDPVTAKGVDQDENPVDLPQTGNNAPGAAAAAGFALFLLLGGAAVFRSAKKPRETDAE